MVGMAIFAGLTRQVWRREAFSGVTLAVVSVPLAVAYAEAAGLPPTTGLYALIVPAVLFALLATSGRLVVGPAPVVTAIAASSLPLASGASGVQLATAQALLAALALALIAMLRLGFVQAALSRPAMLGVASAAVLGLVIRQAAGILGIPVDAPLGTPQLVSQVGAGLGAVQWWAVAFGVLGLAVIAIGHRITKFLPWEILVLAASTTAFQVFGLRGHGIALAPQIQAATPPFSWPVIPWGSWLELIPSAIAIALVTVSETGFVDRQHRSPFGFAAADFAAGITGGFAVGVSPERSRRLTQAGASSQLPGVVSAVLVLAFVTFGASLLGTVPLPTMAAIVLLALAPLTRPSEFTRLWGVRKLDFLVAALAFAATIAFGALIGIAVAVGMSLLGVLRTAASPQSDLVDGDDRPRASLRETQAGRTVSAPGIVIVRFAGPVTSATGDAFERGIHRAVTAARPAGLGHLVIDCEAITGFDATGALVAREAISWARSLGVATDYSRARAALRIELEHYGLLGSAKVFESNARAIAELSP